MRFGWVVAGVLLAGRAWGEAWDPGSICRFDAAGDALPAGWHDALDAQTIAYDAADTQLVMVASVTDITRFSWLDLWPLEGGRPEAPLLLTDPGSSFLALPEPPPLSLFTAAVACLFVMRSRTRRPEKKFVASFFQKRSSSFLP